MYITVARDYLTEDMFNQIISLMNLPCEYDEFCFAFGGEFFEIIKETDTGYGKFIKELSRNGLAEYLDSKTIDTRVSKLQNQGYDLDSSLTIPIMETKKPEIIATVNPTLKEIIDGCHNEIQICSYNPFQYVSDKKSFKKIQKKFAL